MNAPIRGPLSGAARMLTTRDGVELRWSLALPARPALGTVALFTGRTETLGKYDPVAERLLERGLAIASIEWRGQGASQRLCSDTRRGHVDRYADYDEDRRAFLAALSLEAPPRPWTLVGHSMGGLIGMRALLDDPGSFTSAVFSAPMFGIALPMGTTPIAIALTKAASAIGFSKRFAPGQGVNSILEGDFEGNCLTRDRGEFDRLRRLQALRPELVLGGPTFGWLSASYAAMAELRRDRRVETLETPVTVLQATDDGVVCPRAQKELVRRLPSGRLVLLEGSRHEPLIEIPEVRDRALETVFAAAGAEAAAGALTA